MERFFDFTKKLLTERKKSKAWHRFYTALAAMVVFSTTYMLILPALTLDQVTASEEPGFRLEGPKARPGSDGLSVKTGNGESDTASQPAGDDSLLSDDGYDSAVDMASYPETPEGLILDGTVPTGEGDGTIDEILGDGNAAAVKAASETAEIDDNQLTEMPDTEEAVEKELIQSVVYEDASIRITAEFETPGAVPAGTTLEVVPVEPGTDSFLYYNNVMNDKLAAYGAYEVSTAEYYNLRFVNEGQTVLPTQFAVFHFDEIGSSFGEAGERLFGFEYTEGRYASVIDNVTWSRFAGGEEIFTDRYSVQSVDYSTVDATVVGLVNVKSVQTEAEEPAEEIVSEETIAEETVSEEVTADAAEDVNYIEGTLSFAGNGYTVTASFGKDAKIPEGFTLTAKEIGEDSEEYLSYYNKAMEAIGEEGRTTEEGFGRFFDISFTNGSEEIEPSAAVDVRIILNESVTADLNENAVAGDLQIVHFDQQSSEVVEVTNAGAAQEAASVGFATTQTAGEADAVETVGAAEAEDLIGSASAVQVGLTDGTVIEFQAESFSVYGIVYTVDFETMDGGTYSILGGYEYSLPDILSVIGIDLTDSEIVAADFSNTSVLYCYLNEDGLWRLNSVGPFTTQETLTIKTIDNRIIRIKVSDAAIDYDGVTYANIADLSNTIGVTVNGTNLNNEQARNKTFSLTFNFTMLYDNAAAARSDTYLANGTYNWCYDLSQMVADYPEIAEFPDMAGTLRQGTTPLGTYEVIGNKVYLHVRPEALSEDASQQISGKFSLDMQLDEVGTGSKESTTFNFPGGGSFTVKYKPVEYDNGTKSANPTSAVVYPSDTPDGYYYVDYTADISEKVELTSLTFNDILGPGQELVASSVKVNGVGTSVSTTGNADEGQTFSLNVMNALGVSSIPANTPVQITYRARVPKEKIDAAGSAGLPLSNNANWDIGNVDVPGGETTVNLQKGDYTGPTKSIVNTSSYANNSSDKVVDPNSNDKIDGAIKAKEAWQNTDGTYHISYKVSFNEPAVPSTIDMSDTYGSEQSLLTDSFTVTYNGTKYTIPSSYISDEGGSFRINNLKGAIEEATGVPFTKNVNYDINYETQVTAANFNKPITNTSSLIMDKEYPSNETEIELTSEEFQPGTKRNTSGKLINISNTDDTTTSWEISITEPKKANQKAELTDTFDSSRMTVNTGSFKIKIAYNEEYDIPASFVNVSGNQFKIDLNGVLAHLKANNGYNGEAFVEGGKNYAITYTTTTNTNSITQDIRNSADHQKTLENTASWVFKDENEPSEQPGGKDDVTYTIPEYKDTTKKDTVTGNVNKLYSSQNGSTYEVTGAGPYTINYTITVPAQDMDLTKVQLNDTYSTNQILNTGSFVLTVGGQTVTIPSGALNTDTSGRFTLDVLQAMGITKLDKGTEIKLTYSATTTTIGEDITNKSVWSFNSVAGEHTDEKETKEKLDKPEYKPGNKYVRNENANVELTDLTHDDKYRFDWTLTITEPGELTKAILKDDYGTDSKPHTMMISSEHPMTITAGDRTVTFESVEAFAASEAVNYDANTGKFSIDMLKLFNVQKFPAGTTFTAEYSTETTGDTVPNSGTYHNEATWNFDGIGGPKDDVPGGEADTTLTPKEFNDGTKSSFYNGQRLTGGEFREDGSTIIDYVATIGQDSGVTLMNFTDDWGDSRVELVYPIRVKDSSGTVIHTFTSPENGWLSVTDTGFVVQVVKDGKLQNGSDFVEGTTYSVEYSLDFANTANEEGDFDGVVIRNRGHWHTEGDLPPHDDYHETPDEPQSPPWKPIDKAVTNVKYTNSHAGLDPETPLDHTEGSDTWWTDQYTKGDEANHDDNGTFYINYEVTMSQPRDLTGLELADVTNIPCDFSAIRNDATMPNKLTIYDADGNIVTWGQLLGNDNANQAVFDNITIASGSTGGNLSYNFDVVDYLKTAMSADKVTIPKDFTTKLEFQIALWSKMDDEGYPRVNTDPDKWHNKITAKFNGKHEEEDEVDTLIKTRLALDKVFYEVGDTDTLKENGARLDPGSRVKYEITVGHDGDIIPEGGYKITDTMTNVFVQNFDTEAGITVTDKSGSTVAGTLSTHTMDIGDKHYVDGFEYTIPAGTVCPVTIVYYVNNTTQEEADTMNEDTNSLNDLFGEQIENNTVRSPEDKEVTTEYLVNYTTGHIVDKQLSRWDATSGTAFWTVQVTANESQNPAFKAGYKVKEDLYKYTQTAPAGDTWTESEINSAEDMELDLSSVIVMNNGTRLTLGTDYEIQGTSIVLLKEQNAGKILKITNIRTRIPGWQEGETPKTYYYNDASYRTPTDSLLDEDDDNNDTDLVAHLKKKFAEYDPETGNVTWTITITPRKGESLKNYHLSDDFNRMYQWGSETRFATLVSYNAVLLNSNTPLVENVDFTYSQSNTSVFDIKSDISEPVKFTVEYKIAYNPGDLLNAEEFKVYNKVSGNFPNEEPEVSEDEKEFTNDKLTIDKTVSSSDTGEPLQVGEESYPTLKDLGDNTYEYTVRINTDKKNILGNIVLTDYLPDGFELVDYNNHSEEGVQSNSSIPYYDTDLDVVYYGPAPSDLNAENPEYYGGENVWIYKQPELITNSEGKVIGFTVDRMRTYGSWGSSMMLTIKYKVKLTDEKKAELSTLKSGAIQYFENTATARTETRSGTAEETVVYQYTEALKKEDVTDETAAHNGGTISYEILVNAEGEAPDYTHRDLNSGNPLTLTDNIPTSIELHRESVKVYKWNGSSWVEMPIAANEEQIANGTGYSASYHGDTRELILRVADNTSFKVTFDGWAEKTTLDTDGDGDLDNEEGEHFINTATLTGEGQFVAKTDEQHKVYTADGGVSDAPLDGFAIEKFDENNLTKKLNGAEFTLYKVKEYREIPNSYLIPDTNEWEQVGQPKTTANGVAKFSGLSYAQPIGTGESGNGWAEDTYSTMQVVLYAWVESGLSQNLIEEGYQIGDNAAPHFFILYHKAASSTDPVEVKKEASSYALADLFDSNLQQANFITVNKAKTAYTWPVQNAGKTSKTVTKLWDDDNNKKGLRPKANEVHVQLMQNNQPYGDEITLIDATIDKNNPKYTYTWFDLPLTDPETKEAYTYTVQETQIDENYIATYSGDTFTITNHLVDNTTFIANKVWEDNDNVERKRPQSITYTLYQEDESGNLRVYDTQTVGNDENFSYKWTDLPTVDDPDDPTTTYTYFVQETKMTAVDGTEYVLNESTGKLVHDGTALYVSSAEAVEGAENVYKITNTVVSSRTGSVKLTKTLTGLTGNHSNIDAGEGKKADEKTYSVTLTDSDGYKIYAELDTEKSTDELKVYNFHHIQATVNDFTTFEISEKVSVQVNNLPLGAYSYTATENTSGDMIIPGYQFDASASGGSVTAVQVKPENDPDNENPVEANLINNYIPDKGTLSLTKEVRGLPSDVDLTKYRFPVTVSTESTDENGDPVTLYVNAQGKLVEAPMVLYIVPGTPLVIENVPIGSYDVNELYEDENRMPVLTYTGMDEELAAVIAHYSLDTDSSTLQLTGLAVTKNNTRTGKLINSYSPKGSLILDKTVTVEGVTYDAAKLAELKAGDEAEQALAAQIEGITFKVTNFGTKEVIADNITFADILAAKAENGSYTIDNLPYGTYVVTESNTTVGDYTLTTTWTVDDETKSSGQVLLGDNNVDGARVEITNEYEVSVADLTVTKKIDKANSSSSDVSFYVGLFANTTDTTPIDATLVGGTNPQEVKFTAQSSDTEKSVTFTGLTIGTTYYVYETKADGTKVTTSDSVGGYAIVAGDVDGTEITIAASDNAVTITNEYDATGSETFTAKKILKGKKLTAEAYEFELLDSDGTTVLATGKNDAEGNVTFNNYTANYTLDQLENGTATFTYYIREKLPSGANRDNATYSVTNNNSTSVYDTHTATVTVVVTDNGAGTLETTKSSDDTTTSGKDATFTNAEYRKIEVDKKWFQGSTDITDQMSKTNASLKATLSAEGWDGKDVDGNTVTVDVTLPANNSWSASWDKLPKEKADGSEYVYKVTESEVTVAGDSLDAVPAVTVDANGKAELDNTLPTTEQTVTKAWNPATWPSDVASVQATISASGTSTAITALLANSAVTAAQVDLTSSASSKTWTNLPVYDNTGSKITYSVEETSVTMTDGTVYTADSTVKMGDVFTVSTAASGTTTTVTNTPKTTNVPVNKVWAFASQSGITSVAVTDPNNTVTGAKWPEGVTVTAQLYKSVNGGDPAVVTGKTVTLNSSKVCDTFTDLPLYEGMNQITYTVEEAGVTGVDGTKFTTIITGDAEQGFTITNTEKEAGLTVRKFFTGANLTDAEKNQISFTVTGDGLPAGGVTKTYAEFTEGSWNLTQADGIQAGKTYTVVETNADIGKYVRTTSIKVNDGEKNTVTEETITASVPVDASTGTGTVIFTNDYQPEKTEIGGTKVWVDEKTHTAETNAETVMLTLYRTTAQTITTDTVWEPVTATPTWEGNSYKFTNLDKYKGNSTPAEADDEALYTYKVVETPIDNYSTSYTGDKAYALNGEQIINTELTQIKAKKTWKGADTWKENMSVVLTVEQWKGETKVTDFTTAEAVNSNDTSVTISSQQEAEWIKLPRYYLDGTNVEEYTYKVTETKVMYGDNTTDLKDQYNVTGEGAGEDGTVTIDNTPKTTERHARKIWDDNNDAARKRPAKVTFTLKAIVDGTELTAAQLAAEEITTGTQTAAQDLTDWSKTVDWTNLPVYTKAGKLITYDVVESPVNFYTQTGKELQTDDVTGSVTFAFTNKLGTASVPINATKAMKSGKTPGTFTYRLTSSDPMPDKADGSGRETSPLEKTVEGANVSFGTINYTPADMTGATQVEGEGNDAKTEKTFTYTVQEVDESTANPSIKYDPAEYTVTVKLIYDSSDGTLSVAENYPVYSKKVDNVEITPAPTKISFLNEEVTEVTIEKEWKNSNGNQPPEGAEITVGLFKGTDSSDPIYTIKLNGKAEVASVTDEDTQETFTAAGNEASHYEDTAWHAKWTDLPKYENNGSEINYVIKETGTQNGYTVSYSADGTATYASNGGTITNTEDEITLSGNKTWVDGETHTKRPESLEIKLYTVTTETVGGKSTEKETEVTLQTTEANKNYYLNWTIPETGNTWSYTITHLPKTNAEGETIRYRVKEIVPADYRAENESVDGTVGPDGNITEANFINTELTKVSVTKKWTLNDEEMPDSDDGIESITVHLFRKNGGTVEIDSTTGKPVESGVTAAPYTITRTLKEGSTTEYEWKTVEIKNLDKYYVNTADNTQKEYEYYFTEDRISRYTALYKAGEKEAVKIGSNATVVGDGEVTITNSKYSVALPNTGGTGTTPYTLGGALLMAFSALMLITNYRRRLQESLVRNGGLRSDENDRTHAFGENGRGGGSR